MAPPPSVPLAALEVLGLFVHVGPSCIEEYCCTAHCDRRPHAAARPTLARLLLCIVAPARAFRNVGQAWEAVLGTVLPYAVVRPRRAPDRDLYRIILTARTLDAAESAALKSGASDLIPLCRHGRRTAVSQREPY
jgi:hypothetical protein